MNISSISTAQGLAAAGLLTSVIVSATAVAGVAHASSTEWKTERGNVMECSGHFGGTKGGVTVRTTLYDNSRYGSTFQFGLGDPDAGKGAMVEGEDKLVVDGQVKAVLTLNGKKAVVKGTAQRFGARTAVSEQYDDGGFLVKVRGTNRQLRTDLVAKYDGKVAPLTCDTAFFYDLEVKRVPVG